MIGALGDEVTRERSSFENRADFGGSRRSRWIAAEPRRRLQQDGGDVLLVLLARPVVQRVREDPLADKRPRDRRLLADDLGIERLADALGEPQREVLDATGESAAADLWLQQAEPERRREQRTERHRDEDDVDHFCSAAASRVAATSIG